jgi:hypothetical protein
MNKFYGIAPVLFLGAGASAGAFAPSEGVNYLPTVSQFFKKVHFPQGRDARGFEAAWQQIALWIDQARGTSENSRWPIYNAEKLFSCLELLNSAEEILPSEISIPISRTALTNGPSVRVSELLNFLKSEIVRVYSRDFPQLIESNYVELFRLLDGCMPQTDPLIVFTTNYDTVLESQIHNAKFSGQAFHAKPRLCTGFRPGNPAKWAPQVFAEIPAPDERLIKLFKLHGSAIWKWDTSGGTRVPVEMDWRVPTADRDCLIYFGYKSVPEEEPFKTLHDRLKDIVLKERILVAIGFRFEDPYIRETFDMALRANAKLHVLCCLRTEPSDASALRKMLVAFPDRVRLLRNSCKQLVPFGRDNFVKTLVEELDALSVVL